MPAIITLGCIARMPKPTPFPLLSLPPTPSLSLTHL